MLGIARISGHFQGDDRIGVSLEAFNEGVNAIVLGFVAIIAI